MKINKAEFSTDISEENYDKFLDTLRAHLQAGNTVTLKNIGTLSMVQKPAKTMKIGGIDTDVPEAMKIKFKQSRNFIKKVPKAKLSGMDKLVKELKGNE